MSAKVALIRERRATNTSPSGILTMALPFWRSYSGTLIHRVRSGLLHETCYGHHISLRFWCGMGGFLSGDRPNRHRHGGELFANSPERSVHCAVCEGKATGAGMNGARVICGRAVLFQPRI